MDRRERRRRKRVEEKLKRKLSFRESSQANIERAKSSRQSSARKYFTHALSRTKLLLGLVLSGLTLLGGLALFRPHVSVDPDLVLDPGDPFSTQFNITNQNVLFDVKNLQSFCRTIYVITSHNVGLSGLPPRPSPSIPQLGSQEKTTITCPPWIGGLGAGAGNVLVAYIEMDISYRQDWWPVERQERFPLRGVRDSQNGVHWTHITLQQLQADLSKR
jgi:hypothetical protein